MRHDGGAKDAECEIQHVRIGDDLGRWHETARDLRPLRFRKQHLGAKTKRDDGETRNDKSLEIAKAKALQEQHQEYVECCQ